MGKNKTRVITVRMPEWLHEKIRLESLNRGVSMNQLCIEKLSRTERMKMEDMEMVNPNKSQSSGGETPDLDMGIETFDGFGKRVT